MATSDETKKTLSESLKKLCISKPYNNIFISEITSQCHLNRQSFYYHFKDKDNLLYWTYENSDFGIIINNYHKDKSHQLICPLKAMENERSFFVNTLNSNMIFEKFLFEKISNVFLESLNDLDKNNLLPATQRLFLSGYYSFGLCGIIIKWASDGMNESAETVSEYIKCLDFKSIFEVYLKHHLKDQ